MFRAHTIPEYPFCTRFNIARNQKLTDREVAALLLGIHNDLRIFLPRHEVADRCIRRENLRPLFNEQTSTASVDGGTNNSGSGDCPVPDTKEHVAPKPQSYIAGTHLGYRAITIRRTPNLLV